jgi:TatD DNase family protein
MQFIDIHTHHLTEAKNTKTITNIFAHQPEILDKNTENQLFSIGLHPWHLQTEGQKGLITQNMYAVANYAKLPNILAIGETGLDKIRLSKVPNQSSTEFALQKDIFYQHIKISETLQKPLLIHCVKAYTEILAIKKELKPTQTWIFHGFAGSSEIAKALIKEQCFLSFGYSLFTIPAKSTIFFPNMPIEFLFLETDTQTCIEKVYAQAAKLKNIAIENLQAQINTNFHRVFGKKREK